MQFLSKEWFAKVAELREAAGDLGLPPEIQDSIININLTDKDTNNHHHIVGGNFAEGHNDKAEVTLGISSDLARKIFLEMDTQAGMQAFFAGEIQVEGDMTKLMALQNYTPTDAQKTLIDQIIAVTD